MELSLIHILEKMIIEHEALIQHANAKTEAVKGNNIQELNGIITKEQRHLLQLSKLEEIRRSAVYRLWSGKAWNGGEPTISDCYEFFQGEERQQLEEVVQRLFRVITELRQVNELNQQLISQSLQFVNMSLSIFQPPAPKLSYGKEIGGKKPPIHTSIFDSKS